MQRVVEEVRQASAWTLVGWAGLIFTIAFSVVKLPYFLAPGFGTVLREVGQHLYILAWLLLLTTFNRTLRLRTLVVFWFIGIYPAFGLAVLVGRPVASIFGLNGHFVPDFWVPLTEEAIKALPVLLYLAWSARTRIWQTAATDGLLLGFAVGVGFAMHEDIVDRRVGGSGVGAGTILNLFFPSAYVNGSHTQFILGHAGWTALLGLALGLAFLFRHWIWAWLVPLVSFGLVSLDHMTTNFIGNLGRDPMPWYVHASYRLLLRDRLPAEILLVGIFVVVALEQWILRWAATRDRMFPSIPLERMTAMFAVQPNLNVVHSARRYLRYRRAGHFAAWTWRWLGPPSTEVTDGMARVLSHFGLAAGASPGASSDPGFSSGVIMPDPLPSEG